MAHYEFKLPDIGEGVTEGEIVGWAEGIQEGANVQAEQPLVEVMTDKATVVIPCPKSGKIAKLGGKPGEVIKVGQVLAVIETADGGADQPKPPAMEPKQPEPEPVQQQPRQPLASTELSQKTDPKADKPPPLPAAEDRSTRDRIEKDTPKVVSRVESIRESDDEDQQRDRVEEVLQREGPTATAAGTIPEMLPGMAAEPSRAPEFQVDKPLAAPATRRLARELGVELSKVPPSGPSGRVTQEDVRLYADRQRSALLQPQAEPPPQGRPSKEPQSAPVEPHVKGREQRIPLRGLRKRIFEGMGRSKHTAAHFTFVEECDVTRLMGLRDRMKALASSEGAKLTFLPFIVKACVAALKKHPSLNSTFDDSTQEIVQKHYYNIGIATATQAGLMVPVIKDANTKSILEIGREIERLATEARSGKARREDLLGSTFTITSLGAEGGLFATPILNFPEVAILGVHQIKKKPVVRDDRIEIGQVMLLSLSFDHRIIDGHVGAAFAYEIIRYLENPDRLVLEMA